MKKISLAIIVSICSLYVLTSCEPDDNFDETELVIVNDCPDLMANIGDACVYTDSTGNSSNGVINPDCLCVAEVDPIELDCPDLNANIGDSCLVNPNGGVIGIVDVDCNCVQETSTFDCPDLQANFGDACDDGNPLTFGDIISADCLCAGSLNNSFDCPGLNANIGDSCVTITSQIGIVSMDCECEQNGTGSGYDCPDLMANWWDPCDDGDPTTINDSVTPNCICQGYASNTFDCPGLLLNIGDSCALNPAGTDWGIVDGNCECN